MEFLYSFIYNLYKLQYYNIIIFGLYMTSCNPFEIIQHIQWIILTNETDFNSYNLC